MPVRAEFSHNTRQWIVCFSCSLALALITVKNVSFYGIFKIAESSYQNNRLPSGGCPFFYKDSYYWTQEVPLALPNFFWHDQVRTTAISAFYVGRTVTLLPAGVLADVGFSRYVLCGGAFLMAVDYMVFSFFTFSSVALVLENLVEGISEGLIIPSIFTLIVRWAPSSKRNLFTAVVLSGLPYGQILGQIFFKLTYLNYKSLNVGSFATGVVWLVWLILGYFFIHHSPVVAPSTTSSIDCRRLDPGLSASIRRRKTSTIVARLLGIPWRNMLCSGSFLCLVLVFCAVDLFISYNFTVMFEQYQAYVLRLPSPFLDLASSIMVVQVPSMVINGFVSDYIIERNLMSKIFFKKTFIFASMFLATVVQIAATFSGCDVTLFWILSFVAVYLFGYAKPLICTSVIDLAPLYTGVMMGIIFCAVTICNILRAKIDILIGFKPWTLGLWRAKMITYSVEGFVMIIPYFICGSRQLQARISPFVSSTVGQTPADEVEELANRDDGKLHSSSLKRLLSINSSLTGTNKVSKPSTSRLGSSIDSPKTS